MEIVFSWEDGGSAGVRTFKCDCGNDVPEEGHVNSGNIWTCPDCKKRIKFKWLGMGWEEVS